MGCKVVDAVGDMRAHPTGDMGSIGLAGSPEPMIQTAVGGNRAEEPLHRARRQGRDGEGLAGAAHRGRHVRRLHRKLPQSRARLLCRRARGARRHLAGARAGRSDHRGGGKGRERRHRRDLQDDWRLRSSARAKSRKNPSPIRTKRSISARSSSGRATKALTPPCDERIYGGRRRRAAAASRLFPDVIATLRADGEPLSVGELQRGR